MINREIPFFNMILRCDEYTYLPVQLPDGFRITTYRKGHESEWARLETAIGDFESNGEAKEYFISTYLNKGRSEDIFFLETENRVVGTCIAWEDLRKGSTVNSLHWLVVDEAYQGRGLGKALCTQVMNRFAQKNGKSIYIHTQPWSYVAIKLYCHLGFEIQKEDTFGSYENQFEQAIRTIGHVITAEEMKNLRISDNNHSIPASL